ncbi:hypothetical protein OPQ81_007337 [Rhizoctonia solani]|nr:hypothetical protein OPQ81_007337 [Rhizoctonia solani]
MKRRRKRKNNLGLDISSIEILCRRSRVTIDSCYLTRISLVPFLTVQGGFLSKITEVLTSEIQLYAISAQILIRLVVSQASISSIMNCFVRYYLDLSYACSMEVKFSGIKPGTLHDRGWGITVSTIGVDRNSGIDRVKLFSRILPPPLPANIGAQEARESRYFQVMHPALFSTPFRGDLNPNEPASPSYFPPLSGYSSVEGSRQATNALFGMIGFRDPRYCVSYLCYGFRLSRRLRITISKGILPRYSEQDGQPDERRF